MEVVGRRVLSSTSITEVLIMDVEEEVITGEDGRSLEEELLGDRWHDNHVML